MTHFRVVCCLDDPDQALAATGRAAVEERLEALLAPYDENLRVAPYRSYEEGEPQDYWLYRALRQADTDDRDGTGVRPYQPDALGWSSGTSKETPDRQRLEIARRAALFRSLPQPVTWAAVADAGKILYAGQDDDEQGLLIDEESGRAYTLSTYSEQSRWDYWRIGGRWGGSFPYRTGCLARVIATEPGWDSPEQIAPGHCDGGPKHALDLAALRDEAAAKARKTYAEYHALVDHLPPARSWSAFTAQVTDGGPYTIEHARTDYRSQPRVQAVKGTDFAWADDPVAQFAVPEELYAERARAAAVPGFSLVTADGRWMAPGRMGWFAVNDATLDTKVHYWEAANAYVDALAGSSWLVSVDCHI